MSRSNPSANISNPSARFFEWNGEKGQIQYYDKQEKKNVVVGKDGLGFTFLVLDSLSTIKGFNKKAKSSIYSNEVRDTRGDVMIVKIHDGPIIAEGIYRQIKDRVIAAGGKFAKSLYVVYKEGAELKVGNFTCKGAAFGAWADFEKAHRDDINKKAIVVAGRKEDDSGSITFQMPVFKLKDVDEETDKEAIRLDAEVLQPFLKSYLARTKTEQVNQTPPHDPSDENQERREESPEDTRDHSDGPPDDDDSIPF